MKKIFLGLILITGIHLNLNADVSMHSPVIPEHPIVRPPIDPERPTRPKPIIRPALMYGVHYHTYVDRTECDCEEYIEAIKEKDEKIEALIKENERLKVEAHTRLQKRLKEAYDKEIQKFENRGE